MNRLLSFGAARACRRTAISFATMFISLQWALYAQAGSIVVPGAYATTEGNIALDRANVPPFRFQQLYEAAEFASLGGPVLITGVVARPHATLQSGPAAASGGNMDMWMSTTSRTVSTLSTTFAANRGADHTLVASYDETDVFTTANLPGPGNTKQFDVVQVLATPFRYNPAAGNLLLEFRTDGTTLISGSEFFTSACRTGSSCPLREVVSIGAPDATSGVFQNVGEINLLLYEPVLAGDYNDNGVVDSADYVVWRDTLGSTTDLRANGDNSGASAMVIDAADFAMWRAHFGETAGGAANASSSQEGIPEPASLVLAVLVAIWLLAGLPAATKPRC